MSCNTEIHKLEECQGFRPPEGAQSEYQHAEAMQGGQSELDVPYHFPSFSKKISLTFHYYMYVQLLIVQDDTTFIGLAFFYTFSFYTAIETDIETLIMI